MEKFNLDTWLEDKSRKVIDDDGFPVEIIKWDANEKYPVVLLNHNGIAYNVSVDGMYDSDPNHGIFFADEELTEFEKAMIQFSHERDNLIKYGNDNSVNRCIHRYSKKLLNLARKELLKNLPKWKKVDSNPPKVQYNLQGTQLYKDGEYYIELSDLEALPKEE